MLQLKELFLGHPSCLGKLPWPSVLRSTSLLHPHVTRPSPDYLKLLQVVLLDVLGQVIDLQGKKVLLMSSPLQGSHRAEIQTSPAILPDNQIGMLPLSSPVLVLVS